MHNSSGNVRARRPATYYCWWCACTDYAADADAQHIAHTAYDAALHALQAHPALTTVLLTAGGAAVRAGTLACISSVEPITTHAAAGGSTALRVAAHATCAPLIVRLAVVCRQLEWRLD